MKTKLIDDKGRIFGRISAVDILIVLVVLVLCAAIYTRFFTKTETAAFVQNDSFSYQIHIRQVRFSTFDALEIGDTIYDSDNGTRLGVISDISYTPAMAESQLLDGTYVYAPVENRFDIMVDIQSDGLISGGRYYASRIYELNVNSRVEFYTKYCLSSGVLWSIE